ncbi:hypothetical protein BC938DRAFT_471176 [Jimgerdemannia flammicorona]|uniref:Uncharacterized protein n=1 Tax=Jimgerdemannia flammicorona TaxID=994334 RepID=A0A433Q8R8_9FUNG|nr:hypothetical protein BC938DRAFT_471176 [Jimgerdemannia flammicorona]
MSYPYALPTTGAISSADYFVDTGDYANEILEATALRRRLRGVLKEAKREDDEVRGLVWIVKVRKDYLPYLASIIACLETDTLKLKKEIDVLLPSEYYPDLIDSHGSSHTFCSPSSWSPSIPRPPRHPRSPRPSYNYPPQFYPPSSRRALWPLHFEKKRRNNSWPIPHQITSDCKLIYVWKTNDWTFAWVHEKQR